MVWEGWGVEEGDVETFLARSVSHGKTENFHCHFVKDSSMHDLTFFVFSTCEWVSSFRCFSFLLRCRRLLLRRFGRLLIITIVSIE